MVEDIGGLAANVRLVSEDGGESEFDCFLAKFLGAFFHAFVKKPSGVGSFWGSRAPNGNAADEFFQNFDFISGHFNAIQLNLTGIPFAAK
jgi:hypothetical protein